MPDYRGYPVKGHIADVGRVWNTSGTTRRDECPADRLTVASHQQAYAGLSIVARCLGLTSATYKFIRGVLVCRTCPLEASELHAASLTLGLGEDIRALRDQGPSPDDLSVAQPPVLHF